jgi:5-methylthioadenosine/S-adenosylhomocysteine deaminase
MQSNPGQRCIQNPRRKVIVRRTLFKNCRFLVADASADGIIESGNVLVEDELIRAVGSTTEVEAIMQEGQDWDVIDCSNKIVMPGMVDGHNHFGNFMFQMPHMQRNWDQSMTGIEETCFHLIWPAYSWVDAEIAYDLSAWAMMVQLKFGTTMAGNVFPFPDSGIRAAMDLGLRMNMQPLMVTRVMMKDGLNEEELLEKTEETIRNYHDPESLITVSAHPSSSWNCTTKLLTKSMEMAQKYDVKWVMHLLEAPDERERADILWASEGGHMKHLDNLGLLNSHSIFFHCSVMNNEEIELSVERDCAVVHNPMANAFFSGDVAYLPEMLDAGLNVGLGSDSLQNGMFHAMSGAAILHKVMPREKRFLPDNVPFRLATMGSARVYGLEDKIGSLEVGKQADIISIDLDRKPTLFLAQKENLMRFLATNVSHLEVSETMIAGNLIRRDGEFTSIDEEAITARASERVAQFGNWYEETLASGKPHVNIVHDAFTDL